MWHGLAQGGGHLEPNLIGFPNPQDKLFFRKFISVKGIGSKIALKALSQPVARVAAWIEAGDVKALKELPGNGPRAAELIVAELRGKLKDIVVAAFGQSGGDVSTLTPPQRDALEIMVSLGDSRIEAEQWLDRAAKLDNAIDTPEEWLRAAYSVKTGVQG